MPYLVHLCSILLQLIIKYSLGLGANISVKFDQKGISFSDFGKQKKITEENANTLFRATTYCIHFVRP